MTLTEFIIDLRHCGPWELRDSRPQPVIRTASGAVNPGDCPLAAMVRLHRPEAAKRRAVMSSTARMASLLGLTVAEGEMITDAADGMDETVAATEGDAFAKVVEIRRAMIAACGLDAANRVNHQHGAAA